MSNDNHVIGKDDYARLSKNSYDDHYFKEKLNINGIDYKVIDTINHSKSGFEATAYQRADGDVFIGYRGTEAAKGKFWDEPVKDLGADYEMVKGRVNQQQPDAEAFTQRVLAKVKEQHPDWDLRQHVHLTGHSLGGTHAEIEAARHHLGGAGINAYGAADLGYDVPEGQPKDAPAFVGYARASDVVSAGSRHYGTVHIFATEKDIADLRTGRYLDAPNAAHAANPLLTADIGAHFVNNFAPDKGGESIMTAANEARYHQYQQAIDHYRRDVMTSRIDLHDVLNHSRDPAQAARLEARVSDALSVAGYGMAVGTTERALGMPQAEQRLQAASEMVHRTDQTLHAGAENLAHSAHVTGEIAQTGAERFSQGAHTAGQTAQRVGDVVARESVLLSPLDPLTSTGVALGAKGVGYVAHAEAEGLAQGIHLAGQVMHAAAEKMSQDIHATGEVGHVALDVVSAKAHEASQSIHEAAQRLSSTQAHDVVVNKINQGEQAVGAAIHNTEQRLHHAGEVIGKEASQAYGTLSHPMQSLENAVASKISSEMSPAVDATRHQQRALHGEGSQVDRASEARRQQEVQGHAAAHEAPLPPAPGVMSPGLRTAERDVSPPRHEPRPAARDQDAQTHTPTRHEPTTAPAAPDHAALAAQQAHQQAMHAQRHVQQERQPHDERAAPSPRAAASQETGRIAEAAALAPAVAPGIREAATVAPTVAASLRDAPQAPREPSQPDPKASTQAPPEPQRHEPVAAPEHARAQPAVSNPAPAPTPFSERVASAQHDGPQASAQRAVPERANAARVLSPPLDPPGLKDFRHPEHPLNERYQMFRDALGEQGFHQARPTLNDAPAVRGYSAEQKDRLAAGFTAQVGSDRQFNTEIQHFHKNGEILSAIEHPQRLGDRPLILDISEAKALAHTPEQHASTWRARELPEPQAVSTQRPDPQNLSSDHPGHPDHPRNALFENTRDALSTEYGRWGMQKGAEQLDRETVQVMTAARRGQMDDVGAVRLMPNREEGKIGAFPTMQVFETADGPGRVPSTVFVEGQTLQQAPPAQQAAPQFQVVDQQATQQTQQNQQLQAQINAQGPGLGR